MLKAWTLVHEEDGGLWRTWKPRRRFPELGHRDPIPFFLSSSSCPSHYVWSFIPQLGPCHLVLPYQIPRSNRTTPTIVFPQTFLFRIGFGQVFCYSGAKLASRAQELDVRMYLETGGRYVYLFRNFSQYFTNPWNAWRLHGRYH